MQYYNVIDILYLYIFGSLPPWRGQEEDAVKTIDATRILKKKITI